MRARSEGERSGDQAEAQGEPEEPPLEHWYALYTRSHCEQLVYSQVVVKGFHAFLPKIEVWSRRACQQHLVSVPMFSNYLFLRHAMDKVSYLEVRQARGLVRILGERWDRLGVVPDADVRAIQKVLQARLPVLPHPYLKEGQRVRIMSGPLAGAEGILMHLRPEKGIVVLSVDLLQRSIAVEIDCAVVVAA
jgi:transcription termination/antitermination protein NusG